MLREYLELIIYPYKPSAGLPNLMRLYPFNYSDEVLK
jgi:hypothetical protein